MTRDRAISLNAVLDILEGIQADIEDGEGFNHNKWEEKVDDLPPVTPSEYELTDAYYEGYKEAWNNAKVKYDRPPGHWKRISMDKYSEHAKYWYRCDRCGKDNLGNTDWCPNCGARMVEQERSGEECTKKI